MTRRSVGIGVVAAGALAVFYVVVVRGASGSWTHLVDQATADWYYLVLIVGGFGVQAALVAELRQRHRLNASVAAAGGTGMGASTAGMVACCAHHLADLAPFLGATGAAAFLTDYRVAFMVTGIGVNAAGVTVAARRLRRVASVGHDAEQETPRCDIAA